MDKNIKYSHGDFSEQTFKDLPASEFNNTIIKGSCFYHEAFPDFKVFPDDMVGVTFDKCNVDNVFIPEGNTILPNCTHKKLMVQNDERTWEVDKERKPVRVLNNKRTEDDEIIDNQDPLLIPNKLEQTKEFNKLIWDKYKTNRKFLTDNFFNDTKQLIEEIQKEEEMVIELDRYNKMIETNNFFPYYSEPQKLDEGFKTISIKGKEIVIPIVKIKGIVKFVKVTGSKLKINKNKSKNMWRI